MTGPVSGRLIGLIAADLPDHRLVRDTDRGALLVPDGGGPVIELSVRVEKRFLGRTEVARFRMRVPAPGLGPARLTVRHRGRLRREGVDVVVAAGTTEAVALAEALSSDPEFAVAALALDFTRFDVKLDGEVCVATVELMGASLVSIAFPPIRSYVRLHEDQREALIGSLTALGRLTGE